MLWNDNETKPMSSTGSSQGISAPFYPSDFFKKFIFINNERVDAFHTHHTPYRTRAVYLPVGEILTRLHRQLLLAVFLSGNIFNYLNNSYLLRISWPDPT